MSSIKISICIPTAGLVPDKTYLMLQSIWGMTVPPKGGLIQVVVAGTVSDIPPARDLVLIDAAEDAKNGMLAKLRNIAGEQATGDIIVFVDDDFLFPSFWRQRLLEFSSLKKWNILGNRILLPGGGRFWDRCIMDPHGLVSYDHPEDDTSLYQTGGFWIMKRSVYSGLKWNSELPLYATAHGFRYNEDLDMTMRAYEQGYRISFDKENLVWHNDDTYYQQNNILLRGGATVHTPPYTKLVNESQRVPIQ